MQPLAGVGFHLGHFKKRLQDRRPSYPPCLLVFWDRSRPAEEGRSLSIICLFGEPGHLSVSPMRADPASASSGTKQVSACVCCVTNEPRTSLIQNKVTDVAGDPPGLEGPDTAIGTCTKVPSWDLPLRAKLGLLVASAARDPCARLVLNTGKTREWSQDRPTAPGALQGKRRRVSQGSRAGGRPDGDRKLGKDFQRQGRGWARPFVYTSQGEALRDFQSVSGGF